MDDPCDSLPLTSIAEVEPARRQFIEQELRDVVGDNPTPWVIRAIHDAIFVHGKSPAVVRTEFMRSRSARRIIAVTSGKGGVGKTTVAVNLAMAFAGRGLKVLLFDGDLGMANVHIFAGVTPQGTLLDVIEGRANLKDVLSTGPAGIQVVCGASGVASLANLNARLLDFLGAELERVGHDFDAILIDTGAGISAPVLRFLAMAEEAVVVATPNLASTLDAYGIIKVMRETRLPARVQVLVNQTHDEIEAGMVYDRLSTCAQRFLRFTPSSLGSLRRDPAIEASNQSRHPLVLAKPTNKNALRFEAMARRLLGEEPAACADRTAPPARHNAVIHFSNTQMP